MRSQTVLSFALVALATTVCSAPLTGQSNHLPTIRDANFEAGAELTAREALDGSEGTLEDLARRREGGVNGYDRILED